MAKQRSYRVAEAIKEEISALLQKGIKDPRIGFVTVVDVEVSGDLRHARVFVSVMGDEDQKANTLRGLQSAAGFVRSEIGRRLRLFNTPEIRFALDDSIERGVRVSTILRDLENNNE
ncbi:MAG TPA: 30S ribosome-binding factor RbfA [Firmicutes bacterium]|nr:30S ribosome-binding factor RbfA [Bacillota bacterium]